MSALLISYVYIVLISYNNKYDCKTLKHLTMNDIIILKLLFLNITQKLIQPIYGI